VGNPCSADLRVRVVRAHKAGEGTYDEIALRFGVGRASVSRWLRLERETGTLVPGRHGGGQTSKLDKEQLEQFRRIVLAKPDATRAEMAKTLKKETKVTVSVATVGRALRRIGFTRKKSRYTPPRGTPSES
jgi:transposase